MGFPRIKKTPPLIALLVLWAAVALFTEADYTLDDSFWNEESPVGEVERLLREYRQNQELVRNIGAHYYQIIYPVQLRHHEKMGISTRDVAGSKVRKVRSFPQRPYGDGGGGRARSRTGKHFHRTSLLIKAFNHKFRLDLELNTQLLAPNLMQKHFLPSGAEHVSKQEIEHCYYHGTVKDYPGASAAFHTCNGVSGVIHVGNETFVIHPFYGGDLSKHPHVIFEARTKANKGCANHGNLERGIKHYHRSGKGGPGTGTESQGNTGRRKRDNQQDHFHWREPNDDEDDMTNFVNTMWSLDMVKRYKRDVREATKYIETALVIDKAMFDKRNGSTRAEVVHDAIQVANIADLYFRTLNTRVSVVYIETWQGSNQTPIDKSQDISRALNNFNDYTSRKLYKIDKDTTQLLTGETFLGDEAGISVPETVCTAKSVGISVDINTYEPHLLAGTMAHMIGHNIGMGHDDGREECICRDWHGCIMAQSIVGADNVQPYKFSECSQADYIDALRIGHGICLLNRPNELPVGRTCGNGVIEEGEDCDCGTIEECHDTDPCCDPITCKLTKESECASGPCCSNCRLKAKGVICRDATNECDLPEHCSGEHGQCPPDVHKKNGNYCGGHNGYCFNGFCPTLGIQCEHIWGYGAISADKECFEQFNSKGSINGHCGADSSGSFVKCEPENVNCGSLQCQLGHSVPVISGMDQHYSRTIISIKGVEYECKTTRGTIEKTDIPDMGLVRDGTQCGENLICVNQTCTSIFPHIDQGKCPSNLNNLECSGHGVCTNVNKCYCNSGWSGPDCSIQVEITDPPVIVTEIAPTVVNHIESKMEKKTTHYGDGENDNLSTLSMVFILVGVVSLVFTSFASMAVCYRRKSTLPKYDPPFVKKPMHKTYTASSSNHTQEDTISMDSVNKILSFGTGQPYSRADSQRVLFRPVNHMAASTSRFQEHKLHALRRMPASSGSEDDPTHSGEEETVSFIDLPPNNLKVPEKGILKKHYGGLPHNNTEHLELMSRSSEHHNEVAAAVAGNGSASISDVERTLKSLNGYHEDILEALRTAASQRGAAGTPCGSEDGGGVLRPKRSSRASSQERVCDVPGTGLSQTHTVLVEGSPSRRHHLIHHGADEEDDDVPPCGPIRIRNLEDLIRQLEHHSARHMSPSGSEDIRMSETEADRHYRLDATCGEGPPSRCRGSEDTRFVYGRYRQPPGSTGSRHGPPYIHPHHHHHHRAGTDEDDIYESADHERGQCADTPDSESDEFIQAQQQLARWASEEAALAASGAGTKAGAAYYRQQSPPTEEEESTSSSGGGASVARAPPPAPPPRAPAPPTRASVPPARASVPPARASVPPPPASVDSDTAASSSGAEQGRYPEYKH